jgi:hypothetical protein
MWTHRIRRDGCQNQRNGLRSCAIRTELTGLFALAAQCRRGERRVMDTAIGAGELPAVDDARTALGMTATESLLVGVLGTVPGVAAGYGLPAWFTATAIASEQP